MNIGVNIKHLRQKKQLTQEQLADYLGVSYQAISKWETNANTPDISLLPKIAVYFDVSIDTLFSDNISNYLADSSLTDKFHYIKNDDVIRIVQMRGNQILSISQDISKNNFPIEIAFPRNCNNSTQYFKVEVFGHIICDSSINGDVVCHQSIQCGAINGDIHSEGDIKVHEINCCGNINCSNIIDTQHLQCKSIECSGNVNSVNLSCDNIIYKNK